MTVGDRIKEQRIAHGLSQTELAKHLNTTKQAIHKYENNIVTNIPMDKVEILANLFSVSPAYLMGWEKEKPTEDEDSRLVNEFVDLFQKLSDEQQELIIASIKGILSNQ